MRTHLIDPPAPTAAQKARTVREIRSGMASTLSSIDSVARCWGEEGSESADAIRLVERLAELWAELREVQA